MTEKAIGKCFCGKIQFEVALPVKSVVNCHCTMCHRLGGADYTTWVSVSSETLTITQGQEHLSEFHITPQSTQRFCTVCGTRVTTVSHIYPGIVGLLRGIIEGDIQRSASGNYFVSDKAHWAKICNGLPDYGGASGYEPMTTL
jgi:hypothetical protein